MTRISRARRIGPHRHRSRTWIRDHASHNYSPDPAARRRRVVWPWTLVPSYAKGAAHSASLLARIASAASRSWSANPLLGGRRCGRRVIAHAITPASRSRIATPPVAERSLFDVLKDLPDESASW